MYKKSERNRWVLFLFLLAGLVLGSFIAEALPKLPYTNWLQYGLPIGMSEPVILALGVMTLTFGIKFTLNMGGVIGLILGIAAYKFSERL